MIRASGDEYLARTLVESYQLFDMNMPGLIERNNDQILCVDNIHLFNGKQGYITGGDLVEAREFDLNNAALKVDEYEEVVLGLEKPSVPHGMGKEKFLAGYANSRGEVAESWSVILHRPASLRALREFAKVESYTGEPLHERYALKVNAHIVTLSTQDFPKAMELKQVYDPKDGIPVQDWVKIIEAARTFRAAVGGIGFTDLGKDRIIIDTGVNKDYIAYFQRVLVDEYLQALDGVKADENNNIIINCSVAVRKALESRQHVYARNVHAEHADIEDHSVLLNIRAAHIIVRHNSAMMNVLEETAGQVIAETGHIVTDLFVYGQGKIRINYPLTRNPEGSGKNLPDEFSHVYPEPEFEKRQFGDKDQFSFVDFNAIQDVNGIEKFHKACNANQNNIDFEKDVLSINGIGIPCVNATAEKWKNNANESYSGHEDHIQNSDFIYLISKALGTLSHKVSGNEQDIKEILKAISTVVKEMRSHNVSDKKLIKELPCLAQWIAQVPWEEQKGLFIDALFIELKLYRYLADGTDKYWYYWHCMDFGVDYSAEIDCPGLSAAAFELYSILMNKCELPIFIPRLAQFLKNQPVPAAVTDKLSLCQFMMGFLPWLTAKDRGALVEESAAAISLEYLEPVNKLNQWEYKDVYFDETKILIPSYSSQQARKALTGAMNALQYTQGATILDVIPYLAILRFEMKAGGVKDELLIEKLPVIADEITDAVDFITFVNIERFFSHYFWSHETFVKWHGHPRKGNWDINHTFEGEVIRGTVYDIVVKTVQDRENRVRFMRKLINISQNRPESFGNIHTKEELESYLRVLAVDPEADAWETGPSKSAVKVIVVDADGVLWDGIIGEEGLNGIRVTENYKAFQRKLQQLKESGILLAINSKNDEPALFDAKTGAFAHPDMVLKSQDFAVIKVNWEPKNKNMEAIAQELNLGLDSFVFIDDSPQEIDLVRGSLPAVRVLDFPSNTAKLPEMLDDMGIGLGVVTQEDRHRTELYEANRQRWEERGRYATQEEHFQSLGMEIRVFKGEENIDRIGRLAQMAQKINQFNLTTIRYSEDDIHSLIKDLQYRVYAFTYQDSKQPDATVDGLMIVRMQGKEAIIESFLLSCRAIGRTIEDAIIAYVIDALKQEGVMSIKGLYVPTERNGRVKDLYGKYGFIRIDQEGEGESQAWRLNVGESNLRIPRWFKVFEGQSSQPQKEDRVLEQNPLEQIKSVVSNIAASGRRVVVVADKDKTLTASHTLLDEPMALAIIDLIKAGGIFALASGSDLERLEREFLGPLRRALSDEDKTKAHFIYVICNNGAAMIKADLLTGSMQEVYSVDLNRKFGPGTVERVEKILKDFIEQEPELKALKDVRIKVRPNGVDFQILGDINDDQMRRSFDPDRVKRDMWKEKIQQILDREGISLIVKVTGTASINILDAATHKGYGIAQLIKELQAQMSDVVYLGDEFGDRGNDSEALIQGIGSVVNFGKDESVGPMVNYPIKGPLGA
ncbi:MAG: HAD-IIIC family phosphatase, partial [Candidatus Omnitrophica bacterium]|nr:HAD-IIIC family phosphatase [Candidatus Omnitrophota bacterium]